jgi:DNA invertase Pin-like site-specific DNA recombinase
MLRERFMAEGRFISYLRVSTTKQGASGLGLEAQRKAVEEYLNGGRWKLLAEFVEVESGKNNERQELQNALRACRLHGATLLVAKLDRLARNAYFLLGLQASGVDFVACDMPAANKLTVGILAMVAEEEARMISARTTAALRAAKARGIRLGNPENLTHKARRKGNAVSRKVRTAKAAQRAQDIAPTLAEIQSEGAASLSQIAAALNRRRIPAPRGGSWGAVQVSRVISVLNTSQ